jgi:glucose-1-phosphate thymidylyltransferase
MKGIVLAGGLGTRLRPLTTVMNKHLLPVYDKPMIFYPLEMLAEAEIDEVMIVVGGQSTEQIMKLCGNGSQWGFKRLYYAYQVGEGGIAAALELTDQFVGKDTVCVVLGDNLMLGDNLIYYKNLYSSKGAMVLLSEVSDPQNYGVPIFDFTQRLQYIIEKPKEPANNFGVIGVYFYDSKVFDYIKQCAPSKRGELEITDVNNCYARNFELHYRKTRGRWIDAGSSIAAWIEAGQIVEKYRKENWAEKSPELAKKG